ncbi:glutathione peroxidase [Agrococcus sp. ARC_14]|uniref:glutathione peroxidase n=1 Tax=Agrococcus sp. ARC_14 TaxID=2919927 RepID=UPI001F068BB3|nr:glutathione peroxidase [Agrococcus sp. ARC_14]MCH1884021.1 glutathione peroxidase [Agrococcus sp. ARC_14]
MTTLSDFQAEALTGGEVNLGDYDGKVVLVVNTASECGFTPQYEGLEQLWKELGDQGLVVLGFPSDQFGHQEPGTETEIAEFCQRNYGVSFPMFAKIEVNGPGTHPFYQWLKSEKKGMVGGAIKWNFTKFLIGRDGTVLERYGSVKKPEELRGDIEQALAR